jgi:hypothetical protein
VWQELYTSLKDQGFTVVSVALDADIDAARPFIEAAQPEHPSLIDRDHRVAGLYNMINVPQAVWIDERGRVVRPVETAGVGEAFRHAMDRSTGVMTADAVARNTAMRAAYIAALRDWVEKGAASRHVFDAAAARARVILPDDNIAAAHVQFSLAQALLRRDRTEEAAIPIAEARRLHPESWTIWRQTAAKNARGLATHAAFFARVDAAPAGGFYQPVDMEGMSD